MSSKKFDEKEIILQLGELGLSSKESLVYICLLKLGEIGTSKIIKHTKLHGQYVYNSLKTLEEKDLVQHIFFGSRKKFIAKPPTSLMVLAEKNKNTAQDIINKININYPLINKQGFVTFKGRDSVINEVFNLLELQERDDTIKIIGGENDSFVQMAGNVFEEYEYQRKLKNITTYYIGSIKQKEAVLKWQGERKLFKIKLLPGSFGADINMAIYKNAVMFIVTNNEPFGFSIRGEDIASGYGDFFDILWSIAK